MTVYHSELNKCPKCGESLDYPFPTELSRNDGDTLSHRAKCPNCKWIGDEVYNVTFSHYED